MVVLHGTVRNRKGTPVSGLDKDGFQVYEDGVLQQIKKAPTQGLCDGRSGTFRVRRCRASKGTSPLRGRGRFTVRTRAGYYAPLKAISPGPTL